MFKLKETHVEEIKHAKEVIATLSRMQDRIYKQLLEDIGLSKYLEDNEDLEGYLFDIVYNSEVGSEEIDKDITALEQRVNKYAKAQRLR